MLKNKTLLCISYCTCPTVNVNKHLSRLTYGRVPTKGRNYVGTRNLRIVHTSLRQVKTIMIQYMILYDMKLHPYFVRL